MSKKMEARNTNNPFITGTFSEQEKAIILTLVAKGYTEQESNDEFDIIDRDSFFNLFVEEEKNVIEKYIAIKPEALGCRLPYLGYGRIPDDLASIENQTVIVNGKKQVLSHKYLPEQVYNAYTNMRGKLNEETGMDLLISHGYRSPARQTFLFFDNLVRRFDFDVQKTIKRIFFPNYSEHVCSEKQAVDFITGNGKKSDSFGNTQEYQWLRENAEKFGFVESYPQGNPYGVAYEPWHWSYQPTD